MAPGRLLCFLCVCRQGHGVVVAVVVGVVVIDRPEWPP